jgi:hypothetical protein
VPAWHFPAEAAAFFEETASMLSAPFEVTYSTADYLAMLASQSGTRALGERRAEFLDRVSARLRSLGEPPLTATFVGFFAVARLR